MATSPSPSPSRISAFLSSMPGPLNVPSGGRVQEYPMGTVMEVVRADAAILMLMEHQAPRALRFLKRGHFVMKLMLHAAGTILVAACLVGDMHWPLARDAPVVRVGCRSFLFALPGLLYALWFPSTSPDTTLTMLAHVFVQFTHYQDLKHVPADLGVSEDQVSFWGRARERVEPVLRARLQQYGHFTGLSPTAVGGQASELLRAARMSDAAELVMKAFPVGLLNPTHCVIRDLRPRPQNGTTAANGPESYPTIVVFSNIVEVLQFIWVIAADEGHLLTVENWAGRVRPSGFKVWCLNRSGLSSLLRVLVYAGELPMRPLNHHGPPPLVCIEEGEASTSDYDQGAPLIPVVSDEDSG